MVSVFGWTGLETWESSEHRRKSDGSEIDWSCCIARWADQSALERLRGLSQRPALWHWPFPLVIYLCPVPLSFFLLLLLLFPSHLLLPIISRCFIFLMEFCWWCFFFFSLHFSPSPVLGRSRPAKVLRRKYFPRVAVAMSSLSLI